MATHDDDTGRGPLNLPQSYGYDAGGLWVRVSNPDRTHWRYWRGRQVVNELRAANDGGDDVEVTWVAARGTVAEQVKGPGERSTLLASAPGGSVLLEADTDVRTLAYSPHGHRDETAARTTPGFNGEWMDVGSGCYLLGPGHHRPYSPTLGMFLAPDSASPFSAGGLNTLAYCAGDPVNFSDPSGHFLKWLVAGIGIALGVVAVVASFGAASAAVGAIAAGGIAALTKSGAAAIAATTLGTLAVGAEVGALGASEAGDEKAASVLGWVGVGLGIAGAAPAIAKTAMKGAMRLSRFMGRTSAGRSATTSVRSATGGARASGAALPSGAGTPVRPPPPSAASWYATKAPHLEKASQTFTTYPLRAAPDAPPPARPRPAFQRQVGVHPDGSDAATNNAILDDLLDASDLSNWKAPPLKRQPSPAYTTGHLQTGDAARWEVNVAGHISYLENSAIRAPVARWHSAMRSIMARRAAWRDPAPSYDRATLPSYDSLGFGG
ncbi:RHS repeat-associated core domain-containing protein [Stenotrophomonas bentonitica]|uniref:RHS repeat-associated core domain-containing protein n=1 Tax=Stenotrophomonas bentonitica TaxID=1450134 RepID=UPI00345E7EE9